MPLLFATYSSSYQCFLSRYEWTPNIHVQRVKSGDPTGIWTLETWWKDKYATYSITNVVSVLRLLRMHPKEDLWVKMWEWAEFQFILKTFLFTKFCVSECCTNKKSISGIEKKILQSIGRIHFNLADGFFRFSSQCGQRAPRTTRPFYTGVYHGYYSVVEFTQHLKRM